jgi:predicted transposase/invertase (TIGR01784 family)
LLPHDIACKFNDGEQANIEMTLYPDKYEPARMEYYSCKMFTGQELRGKDKRYKDLRQTYQISFLVNHSPYDDDALIHEFEYYDRVHETRLGGRTTIITVELAKVEQIAQKAVSEMSAAESWAVYLRYNADETKRGLLEAIAEKNKGVAMAQEVFLMVSRDEKERSRLLSEYKFMVDLQSRVLTARDEGIELGTTKGIELERNRVLDLLDQGLSAAELKRQLAGM